MEQAPEQASSAGSAIFCGSVGQTSTIRDIKHSGQRSAMTATTASNTEQAHYLFHCC
jgi:hypothetical protein